MTKLISVYSTLTNDTRYCDYEKGGNDLPRIAREVTIKGGTGIATKHLVTPMGVRTKVTREDMAILEANEAFQIHKNNGFIVVREDEPDPEVVAADMQTRDESAPLTPGDFKERTGADDEDKSKSAVPLTGKPSDILGGTKGGTKGGKK